MMKRGALAAAPVLKSWHRSPDDLVEDFDLFGSPDVSWSTSEVAEFKRHYLPEESDGNFWRCKSCSSASWCDDGLNQYVCMACGGPTVDHGIRCEIPC